MSSQYLTQRELLAKAASHEDHFTYSGSPRAGAVTIFLCHSHRDIRLALGLKVKLAELEIDVYIDAVDPEMPATPDRTTANNLKDRIGSMDWFVFLATQNSMSSRWCPWEIGYADAVKGLDHVVIAPTVDDEGRYHGSEYLQLYRRIEPEDLSEMVALRKSAAYTRVLSSESVFTRALRDPGE